MSFIKRHKFLSVVFAVCILLMIKNSSVPYLFTPPSFVSLLFDKPRIEFFLGVAQMVDISMERSLEKRKTGWRCGSVLSSLPLELSLLSQELLISAQQNSVHGETEPAFLNRRLVDFW